MAKRDALTTSRLEAFSDAVIAIVVTIMVLELRAPNIASWAVLGKLWPDFVSYLISFWFVAIFWVNHHHIMGRLAAVREPVLWANISFLFLLSLLPFATAWVGRSGFGAEPLVAYALLIAACGANFALLRSLVSAQLPAGERGAFNGATVRVIGFATLALLLLAVGLASVLPLASLGLIALSSVLHLLPVTRK